MIVTSTVTRFGVVPEHALDICDPRDGVCWASWQLYANNANVEKLEHGLIGRSVPLEADEIKIGTRLPQLL